MLSTCCCKCCTSWLLLQKATSTVMLAPAASCIAASAGARGCSSNCTVASCSLPSHVAAATSVLKDTTALAKHVLVMGTGAADLDGCLFAGSECTVCCLARWGLLEELSDSASESSSLPLPDSACRTLEEVNIAAVSP